MNLCAPGGLAVPASDIRRATVKRHEHHIITVNNLSDCIQSKTYISNLFYTMLFWNNLHRVRGVLNVKILESQKIYWILWARKPKGLNRIAKI